MTPFSTRRVADDTIAVIGEVDASTAGRLSAAFAAYGSNIRIDCSECTFIDSAGLAVLLDQLGRAQAAGGGVAVIDPSPPVRRLLEIAGLLHAFGLG